MPPTLDDAPKILGLVVSFVTLIGALIELFRIISRRNTPVAMKIENSQDIYIEDAHSAGMPLLDAKKVTNLNTKRTGATYKTDVNWTSIGLAVVALAAFTLTLIFAYLVFIA